MNRFLIQALGVLAAFVAVGCADPVALSKPPDPGIPPPDKMLAAAGKFRPQTDAGADLRNAQPAGSWQDVINGHAFSTRVDPFALHPDEISYDKQQSMERVFGTMDWDTTRFTPRDDTIPQQEVEPQPYRRLAGVIVGDSILALVDMGNGQLQLIRPGQDIDGWHVDAINSDEAVLSRSGNLLPRVIHVRLELPPEGSNSGQGQAGAGAGMATPGSPGGAGSGPARQGVQGGKAPGGGFGSPG